MLAIFLGLMAVGFLLFATYKGGKKSKDVVGKVVIWGTLDKNIMESILIDVKKQNNGLQGVSYVQKDKNTYQTELLEELASGKSPDLLLISNEDFYFNLNKIYKIPNKVYPVREYLSNFVDVFATFTDTDGIYAFPFSVDPLIMYYNKSIFASNSIATPPKLWEEFIDLPKKLTIVDNKENIKRSAISFGVVSNVENFKEILINLFLQLGNPIIERRKGEYRTIKNINQNSDQAAPIRFFMEFSNQTSPSYSWNKSLPNSKQFFLSGKLATYFGFASEIADIRKKNPNLIFDIAEIPAVSGAERKSVFAKVYALAIPKVAKNKNGAMIVATEFAGKEAQKIISKKLNLPPVRRDLLSQPASDIYMDIFYKEAIYAQSFIDPDFEKTYDIFKFMIESIYGGKYTPNKSVQNAFSEVDLLFKK